MAKQERLNLRQAAEVLGLDPVRLYRLGRHFRLAPGDPCLPHAVIERAQTEADYDARYLLILDWFLGHLQESNTRTCNGSWIAH